jgi:hypothetical protein
MGAPAIRALAAEELSRRTGAAVARYEFVCEEKPSGPVHIAVERPSDWKITVNGRKVAPKDDGYFVDTAFRLFGTLRNLLGPHHFEGPEITWVGPG